MNMVLHSFVASSRTAHRVGTRGVVLIVCVSVTLDD